VRIDLASSYASLANYWKYLIGQSTMLERYDIVGVKQQEEKAFAQWVSEDESRKSTYGDVLNQIDELHKGYVEADRFSSYLNFGVFGSTAMTNGIGLFRLMSGIDEDTKDDELAEKVEERKDKLMPDMKGFYVDMEKEILSKSLLATYEDLPEGMVSEALRAIPDHKSAKKGTSLEEKFNLWGDWAFDASMVTNKEKADAFLAKPKVKTLQADPIVTILTETIALFRGQAMAASMQFNGQMEGLRKVYIRGMREMKDGKMFYPDANSTMRVTYGKVSPYYPKDGVFYTHLTTLEGVMEKENPEHKPTEEFYVPKKLKELFQAKDYGRYAEDGKLPVNFLSTTDITGGNSGSPVINGRGELIGCAFDGNWEAMASDIYVFPEVTRTISVDARYILFIIDKFAGAGHLLEEMDIRGGDTE